MNLTESNHRAVLVRERDYQQGLANRATGALRDEHQKRANELTELIGRMEKTKRSDRRSGSAQARKTEGRKRSAAERKRIAEGRPAEQRPRPADGPISPPPATEHSHEVENSRRARRKHP